jgi:hypothetical protein
VKAAVEWIVIFLLAGWTHGKDAHGRLFAIIGYILHNSETWTTIGTVNERIAEAAIAGIEEFVQAIFTDSGIR